MIGPIRIAGSLVLLAAGLVAGGAAAQAPSPTETPVTTSAPSPQTQGPAKDLVQRYAIVVGSNKAGGQSLTDLRFADDDALNDCELLAELGMAVSVFTTKDDATRKRRQRSPHAFATLCESAREPFLQSVEDRIKEVVHEVRSAPAGTQSEIVFWFSGHGNGSALFLQNGPLQTSRLRELLLEPTQGYAKVHLILDSCHARKFVVGRGDKSQPLDPALEEQVKAYPKGLNLSVNTHVGALIATTEFNLVHEYSPIEAGILSYELRAALRNAADATGDLRVTYREAEAFVWAANAAVESVDARMYGQAFLPKGKDDAVLADWTDPSAVALRHVTLGIAASDQVRLRVFDARGVPVLETHKGREADPARTTTVFLPADQAYDIDILGNEGARLDRRKLPSSPGGPVAFSKLERGAIATGPKNGEIEDSLERGLFQRAYDARLFQDYKRFRDDSPDAAWLVSKGSNEPDDTGGSRIDVWPWVLGGAGLAALGTGITFNVLARSQKDMAEELCNGSTQKSCTVETPAERREIQEHLDTAKTQRTLSYVSFGVAGAAFIGGAVVLATRQTIGSDERAWVAPSVGVSSAGLLLGGAF